MSFPYKWGYETDHDDIFRQEISAAGIRVVSDPLHMLQSDHPVKTYIRGSHYGWAFVRQYQGWLVVTPEAYVNRNEFHTMTQRFRGIDSGTYVATDPQLLRAISEKISACHTALLSPSAHEQSHSTQ
jgi:hypothetical protein